MAAHAAAAPAFALPPPGFVNQGVVAGLDRATDMAFLADGRFLVTTKAGQVWIVDPQTDPVVAQPYLEIANVHSTYSESGVMSVLLDPQFATNGYVYVYYAHEPTFRFRISRFTHGGNTANPASEVVIWSDDEDFASCCHWGGGLDFGADGKLYLTTGNKTPPTETSNRSQMLGLAGGKILRLNPDGSVPADNPFHDGAGPNYDAIWARGLRNPFRARFDPPTGRLFIAEVGGDLQEDVHLGRSGANYGWPACEGLCTDPAYDDPIFTYPTGSGASITGGFVYRGALFGSAYHGAYFFGDYVQKWIRYLTFDAGGAVTGEVVFEPAAGDVVALAQGPEGALYYVNHSGAVRRITLGSAPAVGTITFDAASLRSASACTASTTLTIPGVVVGNDPHRILVATIATEQFEDCDMMAPGVSVTYGGQPMTRATAARSNRRQGRACSAIFYMLAPPAGTANVVATWPSAAGAEEDVQRFGAAYVISGAAQEPPHATAIKATESSTASISTAIATFIPGAFVADVALVGNAGSFTTQTAGQHELFDLSCSGSSAAGSRLTAAAPGIHTMAWQHTAKIRLAQSVAAFAPHELPDGSTSTTVAPSTTGSLPPSTLDTTTTTTTLPQALPISLDSGSMVTACSGSAADTLIIPNVAVASAQNQVLVVSVGGEEDNADCDLAHAGASVRYGTTPLALAVAARSGTSSWRACNGIFYLLNPPAGTASVTIQFPATTGTEIDNRHAAAYVLRNVAQQPPLTVVSAGADLKTNPISTAMPAQPAGAWIVDVVTQGEAGTFAPTQPSQSLRWQRSCTSSSSAGSTREAAAGSTVLGWSHSKPKRYAHALASFAPAAGGAVTTTIPAPPTTTSTTTSTTVTTTTTLPDGAPIALDAASLVTACSGTAADTLTIPNVPVTPGPNRVLVVSVGAEEDNADCDLAHAAASVRYGSTSMTLAVAARSGISSWRACNGIFYLANPPVGTANVTIQFPATTGTPVDNRHAAAYVLRNVAQQPPLAASSAGANATTNPIATAMPAQPAGAWIVDVVTQGETGTFAPTQPGQALRWQRSCTSSSSAGSTREVVAGTTALGWSHSNPKRYAHALAAFERAAGGGSGTTTTLPVTTTLPPTTTTLPSGAPIALDPASIATACGGSAADSLAISNVTVGTQANRVLVVTVGAEEDDADCDLAHAAASVRYGTTPMTLALARRSDTSSWRTCNGVFYLLNPPVGTANVTVQFPTTIGDAIDNRHAGAFVLYNVAQQPPQSTASSGNDATTNPIATSIATPVAGVWVVDVVTQGNAGTFTATQAGQTLRWQRSCTSSASATSTRAVSGSPTAMGWSHSDPKRYAHALITFTAAAP